jgi:hypothetical protein
MIDLVVEAQIGSGDVDHRFDDLSLSYDLCE